MNTRRLDRASVGLISISLIFILTIALLMVPVPPMNRTFILITSFGKLVVRGRQPPVLLDSSRRLHVSAVALLYA